MKCPCCAPPSDEAIQEPFLLHNKKKMRLVAFHFKILMTPCSLDSKDEGEKKALNEVDGPCCAIKEIGLPIEEGVIPEDETIMHAENTKVLEVPAQQETVSYPPLLVLMMLYLVMKRRRRMNFQMFQTLHAMTQIVTLLITLMSSYMLGDVGGI
jgi:hypothetical protein